MLIRPECTSIEWITRREYIIVILDHYPNQNIQSVFAPVICIK